MDDHQHGQHSDQHGQHGGPNGQHGQDSDQHDQQDGRDGRDGQDGQDSDQHGQDDGQGGGPGWWEAFDRLEGLAGELGRTSARPSSTVELPVLEGLLDLVGLTDRLVAMVVERLIDLQASGEVETVTGLPVTLWLSQVARRTRADVRMLETAAELLPRLPGLRAAFGRGEVSWSQVRAVILTVRTFRVAGLEAADDEVCRLLTHAPDADPDRITTGLSRVAFDLDQARETERTARDEAAAEAGQFFALQPRLDGTGGRVWGELAADGFATLDAAINTGLDLTNTHHDNSDHNHDRAGRVVRPGRQRAQRLIGWARHALHHQHLPTTSPCPDLAHTTTGTDTAADSTAAVEGGVPGGRPRSQVLIRTSLDTLLGGQLPAELITTLTGGKLTVTSHTARRIIDEGGADLRTIILDDTGQVVGVGRRNRTPPGWLTDAVTTLNTTCTAPGCHTSVRRCDLDHAQPWHPRPNQPTGGTTDITNLAPLCRTHNRTKETDGWTATGTPDGQRHWHHPRTGLTHHHLPDHWQPPPDHPDPADDPDPGDPPHHDPDETTSTTAPPDHDPTTPTTDPPADTQLTVDELLHPPHPDLPF